MKIDEQIIWSGDLEDDCTAIWNGLILRAEWMDEDDWWWAVSVNDGRPGEIDSSNNYNSSCIGGDLARKLAEQAAVKYLSEKQKLYNIVVLDIFTTSRGLVAIFDTSEKILLGTIIQKEDGSSWKIIGTSMPILSEETNAYKYINPPRLLRDCLIVAEGKPGRIAKGDRLSLK